MKVSMLLISFLISVSAFASSPLGNWNMTSVRCHLGSEFTQTPFDPATGKITWTFKDNTQYQINVQNQNMTYLERGNFAVNSAQLCMAAYDGFSSTEGYRRYDGRQVCGSFVQTERALTVLFEVRNPNQQGCPMGDLVELSFAKQN